MNPGNWPPSPGFAPWDTLISISSQLFKYSAVTPNLAEAICLTLELALSPLSFGIARLASSPPSPLHDAPPILFIAIAKVSCASFESAPKDMLPLPNLFLIFVIDSTSSIRIGFLIKLKSKRSLRFKGCCSLIIFEYFLYKS